MSATPPPADPPSPGEESTDPAAQAEREEALRILLGMPDAPPAPRPPRAAPAMTPTASLEEVSLPVARSAAAAASHPWTLPHFGLLLLVLALAGTLAVMMASRLRGGARATRCA